MSTSNKITMYLGDTKRLIVSANYPDGTPYDLAGVKLWFTAKERARDPDSAAIISKRNVAAGGSDAEIKVLSPASDGVLEVYILKADTHGLNPGNYRYDVQLVSAAGEVSTLVKDQLILKLGVTDAS